MSLVFRVCIFEILIWKSLTGLVLSSITSSSRGSSFRSFRKGSKGREKEKMPSYITNINPYCSFVFMANFESKVLYCLKGDEPIFILKIDLFQQRDIVSLLKINVKALFTISLNYSFLHCSPQRAKGRLEMLSQGEQGWEDRTHRQMPLFSCPRYPYVTMFLCSSTEFALLKLVNWKIKEND